MFAGPINEKVLTVREKQVSVANLLGGMGSMGASGLYLKIGSKLHFKMQGRVVVFDSEVVTRETMEHVLACFLSSEETSLFHQRMAADIVHQEAGSRYRVHFGYDQTGPYGCIRVISDEIMDLVSLGLPESTQKHLRDLPRGLFLVAGPTDSGKTVTCTSTLEHHNTHHEKAILSLEAPIEFVFSNSKALVFQREVGVHVPSFADGVRSALRESLDMLYLGECRQQDTIEEALRAAELGHQVITTVHADSCLSAISRLMGSFPLQEQPRIRQAIASSLAGVLYQRLLPKVGGGRIPCIESIWPNRAVRTIMRTGELSKLASYVGPVTGGIAYQDCLKALRETGLISPETFDAERGRSLTGH
ncbi:MAG: ATPase, T2SS/T4P/T4SS family [Myxococcota bacterium]|nr:ATPase, T2SS/T4P/T4SS family [Myxococcota bacterium]